jgi:TatA/E family protein of Tat protein translocase
MGPLSFTEVAIIFFVALLVFGPRKLPEIGRTLGKGLREFRKASDELKHTWTEQMRDAEEPIRDIKKTLQDAKTDVEASVSAEDTEDTEESTSTSTEPQQESTPATITDESPASPEESRPEGHAN